MHRFPYLFLCTDLDGNLSFTLNPLTASKLDHFLLTLPVGLSETANKDKEFDQHFWNENKKRKHRFIDEIVAIALSATQIPLSIFTNLFHKRFEKHSMLESMLEILQQFYIQMEIEPDDFTFFPGDSSLYTLGCVRCCDLLLLLVQLEELYYMHPLQCYITGT